MDKSLVERLYVIQQELDAPKNQWNDFSKFYYRSCEDILEGVKPLLKGLILTMSDEVVMIGDRIYVKSTATISDGKDSIINTAMAREPLVKKGMDESQITGTASSYARKYSLNGLFCIDDEKDADSKDSRDNKQKIKSQKSNDKPWYNEPDYQADLQGITSAIKDGTPVESIINQISQNFRISNKYKDLIRSI